MTASGAGGGAERRRVSEEPTQRVADPYTCRCLYVGGAKKYSAYQHLVEEQQIAQERIWPEEDAMNWALWSPWYWR